MHSGYGHDALGVMDVRHDFRSLRIGAPNVRAAAQCVEPEGTLVRPIRTFAIAWLAVPGLAMILLSGAALCDPLKFAQQSAAPEAPQAAPAQDNSPEAKMS